MVGEEKELPRKINTLPSSFIITLKGINKMTRQEGKNYLMYMKAIEWAKKHPNKKMCIASLKGNIFIECKPKKEIVYFDEADNISEEAWKLMMKRI